MYRITIECEGLTQDEGAKAPPDIIEEFAHRPWQQEVKCSWTGSALSISATNDYDKTGSVLLDEVWDAVHACVHYSGGIHMRIVSVEEK